MAACVIELSVNEMGLFTYNFPRVDSPLQRVGEFHRDLNLCGASDVEIAIHLQQGKFVGFRARAGTSPSCKRGWKPQRELEKLGMYPNYPAPWPPPSGPCNTLEFRLNLPEVAKKLQTQANPARLQIEPPSMQKPQEGASGALARRRLNARTGLVVWYGLAVEYAGKTFYDDPKIYNDPPPPPPIMVSRPAR